MMTSLRWQHTPLRLAIFAGVIALVLFAMWLVDTARIRQAQSDPAAKSVLAAGHLTRSSTDSRVEALQQRIRSNPDDRPAYTGLGAAYLQKARESGDPAYYPKAEGVLRRALESEPDDLAALVQMGLLSLARHQFRDALDWGRKAQALSPDTAAVYGVIGDAQVELGRYDAATETVQAMIDLRPDLSSYSRGSYIRELHGDVAGAFEAMQLAVDAGGPNAENTNWTRVQLGHLYFNSGRLDQAEAQYELALETYPGYVHALAGLARVHAARREYDEAIKLYTVVVNRMPLPEYVIALGDVIAAAGRTVEAQQQFDLVRAIERLYLANDVDTDLEMALFAADHSEGHSPGEAIARARRALEKRPTIFASSALAWALYQNGRYAEAYAYSQQALRLGTQDALLLFHAGMIAHRLGRTGQARAYLERALALNPYFSVRYADVAVETLASLNMETNR